MPRYGYLVHGLRLASDSALPISAAAYQAAADVIYCGTAGRRPIPPPRHSRYNDPDDPWVGEHWLDDALVVEFPGWAAFEVRHNRVELLADETDDPDLVAHLLLDHVLPRLVALRGDLILHASGAVAPDGRAVLFVAPTGTGKSTLATALAAAGWPLLDDDAVRVVACDAEGQWCAVPGYAGVRLLPDSARAVLPGLVPSGPMTRGSQKYRYPVEGSQLRMAADPVPVGVIYVLERADVAEAELERFGFGAAVGALVAHGFHLADEPADITRRAFERTAALAAGVPVHRLRIPIGLDRLGTVLAAVTALQAER